MKGFDLESMLLSLPAVLIGLTVHEFMHAFTAYKLGDSTARDEGRVTLNPLKHIDPIGFLFIIIAGFGWAKPVRFSRENLKHPGRDEVMIALAGPLSNLVLSILGAVVFRLAVLIFPFTGNVLQQYAIDFLLYFIYINMGLFVFNSLPLPPLDGSHLLFKLIKVKPATEALLYKYGTLVLFAVILIGNRTDIDLLPIGKVVEFLVDRIFFVLGMG
jgi:Zn-dependent protease